MEGIELKTQADPQSRQLTSRVNSLGRDTEGGLGRARSPRETPKYDEDSKPRIYKKKKDFARKIITKSMSVSFVSFIYNTPAYRSCRHITSPYLFFFSMTGRRSRQAINFCIHQTSASGYIWISSYHGQAALQLLMWCSEPIKGCYNGIFLKGIRLLLKFSPVRDRLNSQSNIYPHPTKCKQLYSFNVRPLKTMKINCIIISTQPLRSGRIWHKVNF